MTDPDTSVNARQELEKMNVTYSQNNFLSFVLAGNVFIVKKFLLAGMSPHVSDKNGITALMWAAGKGHTAIVQLLLKYGVDVNFHTAKGRTALMSAAYYGRIDILKILINHGADPRFKDFENKTAYDWSRERKKTAIAEFLKELQD